MTADSGFSAGLMFHEVSDDAAASGYQRIGARPYTCSIERFERSLDAIDAAGAAPTLVDGPGVRQHGRQLFLTFDDGGRSAVTAADRLLARGWHGHFFIVTSRLGTRGFLDRTALRYLASCGHRVGSHSHSHPDIFRALAWSEMCAEWNLSRSILEQVLGIQCRYASLPGGDLSVTVADSARQCGFEALFTSEPWRRPRDRGGCALIGRFAVKRSHPPALLGAMARGIGWERALLRRRCSVAVRRGLGPLYHLYVQHATALDRVPVPVR